LKMILARNARLVKKLGKIFSNNKDTRNTE
jgi:hypothetical protein